MKHRLLFLLLAAVAAAPSVGSESLIADRTLVMAVSDTGIGFNPIQSYSFTEAQLFSGLYEGLVSYHPFTLEPLPGAARRWEVSPDGKVYRFFLREDGRFWNGDTVTAADFRDTWMLLLDPREEAPYSFLLDIVKGARAYRLGQNGDFQSVGIRAVDALTLEVELNAPADHFLKLLCHHSFAPLHPLIRSGYSKDRPIPGLGNGPYFLFRQEEKLLTFRRNELYWDAANVAIREIRVLLEDDAQKTAELFNRGEVHWSMGNINIEMVENTQALILNSMYATSYFYFAAKTEPFGDTRVTRALALLLPWEEIRSPERYNIPTARLVPEVSENSGYPVPESILESDREEALALLEEAGFPGGRGLPPIVLRIPAGAEGYPEVAFMKETWEGELETSVELEPIPGREYYDSLKKDGYVLGQVSWIGDFADPLTFLQMWVSDSNLNDGGYSSPGYDALMEKAAGLTGEERLAALSEAESLLLKDGIVLPLNHQPAFNVVDLGLAGGLVGGWFPNPMDIHPFKYLYFSLPQAPSNVALAVSGER